MDWLSEHLLTIMILIPITGAAALAAFRADSIIAIRRFALAVSLATLAFTAIAVTGRFFQEWSPQSGGAVMQERANWITESDQALPRLRIQYHVGLDGISLPLVLLTALLT